MSDIQSYHVEWFVTDEVRHNVTVRIGDGFLLDVEQGRTANAIDLGPVALVDGLVNAHTHLEFSSLQSPISPSGRFTDWIRQVVKYRREHADLVGHSIRLGIRECLESGTTLVGEIATTGWPSPDEHDIQLGGVVFQEVLGLSSERIAQQSDVARTHLLGPHGSFAAGISPHAPYSTHRELVCESVELARKAGCPLAMHLAETEAEIELLANGTGEFREMLSEFGLWRDDLFPPGQRPIDYLEILAQAPRSLVVHGNYLDDDELRFLGERPQMTLVYCPRTHAAFGHSEHPWQRLQRWGGRVAIGTDSRASNPDLSLFAELQFLAAQHPVVSHVDLLQLGSRNGRVALGFEPTTRANLTLIDIADCSMRAPERDLFDSRNRVIGTMIEGKWVWRESR